MAFASRREDGKNRLCKRMGNTISHLNQTWWPDVEISFPSIAKAKACADELNEQIWPTYGKSRVKPDGDYPLLWETIDIIHKHEGITDAEYKKVRGEE